GEVFVPGQPAVGAVVRGAAEHDLGATAVVGAGATASHRVGQARNRGVQLLELSLDEAAVAAAVLDDDHRRAQHDEPQTEGAAGEQVGNLAGDEVDAGRAVPGQADEQEPDGHAA